MNGLPAFFQTQGKTVVDELTSAGQRVPNQSDPAFQLGGVENNEVYDDDAFGDLNDDNLPDFFRTSASTAETEAILAGLSIGAPSANKAPLAPVSYKDAFPPPPGFQQKLAQRKSDATPISLSELQKRQAGGQSQTNQPYYETAETAPLPKPVSHPPGMENRQSQGPSAVPTKNEAPSTKVPQKPFSYAAAVGPATASNNPPQSKQQNTEFPSAGMGLFNFSGKEDPATVRAVPVGISPSSALFSANKPLLLRPGKGFAVPAGSAPAAASIAAGGAVIEGGEKKAKTVPRGKFMSPSDVRFVVNRVLQPLESNDPYSDDFYYLQASIKKNTAAREQALREQRSEMPPMIYVPLPTWKDTKERIRLQMEMTRKAFMQKSREWEQKEQVLGHMVRHDATKPKAQLSIPLMSEIDFDLNDNDLDELGDVSLQTPFSSRLWTMRLAVQRGYEALYTVQELHHLMSSPVIGSNPEASAEIQREIQTAVNLLSQSVGIRTTAAATGIPGVTPDFSLDGGHVGAILQTNIGKKLISRSVKLLNPPHRWALLPVILAKTLLAQQQQSASDSDTVTAAIISETQVVEQRLLRAIIEFLQYSYQFQIEQQNQCPPGVSADFTNLFLSNLRQCIKSVMITQMEKEKLIQTLISERTRAEVMHLIVQIGDKVCATANSQLAEEWTHTREAFISMLDQ